MSPQRPIAYSNVLSLPLPLPATAIPAATAPAATVASKTSTSLRDDMLPPQSDDRPSLAGADAVVHLAAIPASGIHTEETTFRTNMLSTFNVFEAARVLGLQRVVWASSETILGLPFERELPAYAPIDEEHPPLPQSSYALSKLLAEEAGRQLHRRSGTPSVALRFSNIMEPHDYERFPSFWDDPMLRRWNLWGYVDARAVALSCRLALTAPVGGEHFIVAAADPVMNRPSAELVREVYPSVEHGS